MYPFEDIVDSPVVTSPIPPPFNNSFVVAIYCIIPSACLIVQEVSNQVLKFNGLCPANDSLPFECPPAWYKAPGPPLVADDDGDSKFEAHI